MKKLLLTRLGAVFAILVILLPMQVSALSSAQKDLFNSGIYYFNADDSDLGLDASGCTVPTYGTVDTTGSDTSIWQSGLQPPYILEQFAIETLKDVAKKLNIPDATTVTQEHVIALLAFMFGEGGDINNSNLFNPLNTGINDPALLSTGPDASGNQSFKSFDAGVEATARTLVGSNQSRLAAVLAQSGSAAGQFMYALAYYNKYPGNKFWAQASEPPNQDKYYRQRLELVQQVRSGYADIAGLVIGTPDKEQQLNETNKSKLQLHPTGDQSSSTDNSGSTNSTGSTSSCNSGGIVSGSVAQTALGLAWPQPPSSANPARDPLEPTPAYQQAVQQFSPNAPYAGADCGAFVGIVMRASGADSSYPLSGTAVQQDYVQSHPEKYTIITDAQNVADLQPGDIAIVNQGSGSGASGHTYIYVGPQAGGYNEASASMADRMPSLGSALLQDDRGHYVIARLK